jgi:hypothetical protein
VDNDDLKAEMVLRLSEFSWTWDVGWLLQWSSGLSEDKNLGWCPGRESGFVPETCDEKLEAVVKLEAFVKLEAVV